MLIERTSIRRLSQKKRTILREFVLSSESAFHYYLTSNVSHVSIVIFWNDEGNVIAWGCLDRKGAFPRYEGYTRFAKDIPLMGWYVVPEYRGKGYAHKIAENLLKHQRTEIAAEARRHEIQRILERQGFKISRFGGWLDVWNR